MCGRFVLAANPDVIQTAFNLNSVPAEMTARYNIAPTQPVAVITNDDPRALTFHRWGLIPSWAKDTKTSGQLINARSETAHEKPAFRSAFKRRRCLIPADGFYEWRKEGSNKTPMFIHLKDRPVFAMAGLWEVWRSPDGDEIRTCTILTTEANAFMQNIHNRMPVILNKEDYGFWLSPDEESVPALQALMRPFNPDALAAYPVSTMVNRPNNDTADLIKPMATQ
jgi:putative SOS response-associated peptidase YedK